MVVGACVGAGDAGRGGEGKGATFCLQVWESVVSAGWGRARRLFPSAGKQCPRRVFYGSCWTLISFVARLSSAAAALSPQKRAPPPQPPGKPRTTRLRPYPASATTFAVSPAGKCVTNQLMINLCELKNNNNKKTRCEFRCIKDITNE